MHKEETHTKSAEWLPPSTSSTSLCLSGWRGCYVSPATPVLLSPRPSMTRLCLWTKPSFMLWQKRERDRAGMDRGERGTVVDMWHGVGKHADIKCNCVSPRHNVGYLEQRLCGGTLPNGSTCRREHVRAQTWVVERGHVKMLTAAQQKVNSARTRSVSAAKVKVRKWCAQQK